MSDEKWELYKANVLIDLFFAQLMNFSEAMNDSQGLVENCKYADYILYSARKMLLEKFPDVEKEKGF